MKLLVSAFFTLLLLGFAGSSYAQFGLFGPSDYDECILENMKGVTSDLAARAVVGSCREKFPTEVKKSKSAGQKLTSDELANVQLNGGNWLGYDYMEEFIYNGNDFDIKEVVIAYKVNKGSTELHSFELVFASSCVKAKTSSKTREVVFPYPKDATGWSHRLRSAVKC